MKLSKQSLEILLDLVEIKLSTMQVHDREDARELVRLRNCRDEIMTEYNRRSKKSLAEPEQTLTKPLSAPRRSGVAMGRGLSRVTIHD
jgi:hypothetical protein